MPDYRPVARRTAKKYGIPVNLFMSLVSHESGWDADITSPAGAIGLAQLMPDTARGLGVDPRNPAQNLDGGARYLAAQYKRFGSWRLALAAYNAGPGRVESGSWSKIPETTSYVRNVLADAGKVTDTAAAATAGGAQPSTPLADAALGTTTAPQMPDLAGAVLQGLSTVGHHDFDPLQQLSDLVGAAAMGSQGASSGLLGAAPQATEPTSTAAPAAGGDPSKWLQLPKWSHASGAAEPGQPILGFAASIARQFGKPLGVSDTTAHSKMTSNGTVSAHWTGNALDIPATGARLMRLGRIALMQAGMPRKQAMRAGPGLYNLGGFQVIFGTNDPKLGGDHTTHLHVGIRG